MSLLLLPADPGTRWPRTAGPSSYPLDHGVLVQRIILIFELHGYFYTVEESLTEKFFKFKYLPAVSLELLNLGLLGRRFIH